jgi:histidinol-phosphate aminotransferase
MKFPFTKLVEGLPASIPFVGPEAIERGTGQLFRARIGANESAFGISPLAAAAMQAEAARTSWYADPEGYELKCAIADRFNVEMDEICLGAGVDELLGLVVRMVVEPGVSVVTSLGAYPTFNYHVDGFGGTLHKVPYRDDHIDIQAVAQAAHEHNASLVYFANPDNPMGTWHDANAIGSFIAALPESCLLVFDEAYVEFAPEAVQTAIDTQDERVIRMRTFSKAHGMAGARVGFAIAAKPVIQSFNKVRNHFGMNRVAMAGALASFNDQSFVREVVQKVGQGRREYAQLAESLGLRSIESATNFVAIDVNNGGRARALLKALQDRGVFVRMPGVTPLDRCIRVSVGLPEERAIFAEAFTEALKIV